MSTQRRSPSRPTSAATTAKTAVRKASARTALPRLAVIRGGELRRALGDKRVAFADENAAPHRARQDNLAAAAEGVGDGAGVGDRNALAGVVAVGHAEADPLAVVADRALDDSAGQLIVAAGANTDQLRGLFCLRGSTKRRVDERSGEHDGDAERDYEPDLSLALGIHELGIIASQARGAVVWGSTDALRA